MKSPLYGFGLSNRFEGYRAGGKGLPPYGGGADPHWSGVGLLIDFPYYHALGVQPGDTVYDMTGQHQFTIPAGSSLNENGWARNGASGITIPGPSTAFDQFSNWWGSVVWAPEGANRFGGNLLAAWTPPSAYDWYINDAGVRTFGIRHIDWYTQTNYVWSGDPEALHFNWSYTNKQRIYATNTNYGVYTDDTNGQPNRGPIQMEATNGRYRIVRIGRNGEGGMTNPGSTGANPVPTTALANTVAGKAFNPTTGLWT